MTKKNRSRMKMRISCSWVAKIPRFLIGFLHSKPFLKFEAKTILEVFNTKIKQIDEFEYFKSAFVEIKQNNKEKFLELISALPQNKQNYLKEVLFSQRIILSSENHERTTVRKIVKTKKKKKTEEEASEEMK